MVGVSVGVAVVGVSVGVAVVGVSVGPQSLRLLRATSAAGVARHDDELPAASTPKAATVSIPARRIDDRRGPDVRRDLARYAGGRRSPSAAGEVVATFTLHLDHSSYQLRGAYDEKTRRLYLRADAAADPAKPGWKPCDAEAYLSADFSTLTGMPICASRTRAGRFVSGGDPCPRRHGSSPRNIHVAAAAPPRIVAAE